MFRLALLCFGLVFVLMELWQGVRGFVLPLPVYLLAGALLAIASNVRTPSPRDGDPPGS